MANEYLVKRLRALGGQPPREWEIKSWVNMAFEVIRESADVIERLSASSMSPYEVRERCAAEVATLRNDIALRDQRVLRPGAAELTSAERAWLVAIDKAVSVIRTLDIPAQTLRGQATQTVLRVRGSHDAAGFDACVEAELDKLITASVTDEEVEAALAAIAVPGGNISVSAVIGGSFRGPQVIRAALEAAARVRAGKGER